MSVEVQLERDAPEVVGAVRKVDPGELETGVSMPDRPAFQIVDGRTQTDLDANRALPGKDSDAAVAWTFGGVPGEGGKSAFSRCSASSGICSG